jgi:hypothetical protein
VKNPTVPEVTMQKRRAKLVTGSGSAFDNPKSWRSPASGKARPGQRTNRKSPKAKTKSISEEAFFTGTFLWKKKGNTWRLTADAAAITSGGISISSIIGSTDYAWMVQRLNISSSVVSGKSRTLDKAKVASLNLLLNDCPPNTVQRLAQSRGFHLSRDKADKNNPGSKS